MIRLAGLFVLVVAVAMWVLFASSILDAVGNGGRATVLDSVTPGTPAARPTATPSATLEATDRPTPDEPTATATATAEPQPATPTLEPTPAPTTTTGPAGVRIYIIEQGDNLTRIANRFDVSVEALQDANGITDPSSIKVGQELVIPDPQ